MKEEFFEVLGQRFVGDVSHCERCGFLNAVNVMRVTEADPSIKFIELTFMPYEPLPEGDRCTGCRDTDQD